MDILIRKKYAQERERKNEKKLLCIVVAVIVIVLAIFTAEYCKSQKILRELESLENGYQEFELEGYKKNFVDLDIKYVGQAWSGKR